MPGFYEALHSEGGKKVLKLPQAESVVHGYGNLGFLEAWMEARGEVSLALWSFIYCVTIDKWPVME